MNSSVCAVSDLVLSIFPGLDVLGMGFEAEGFCVVQGPDVLWGGDIRRFHPLPGRFDGVIGGDPCQAHSALANLVRAKGLEPRFGDLSGEYRRIVEEARPAWFLRENVVRAPDIEPTGYDVRSFVLDHSTMDRGDGVGHDQIRKRRFWFGTRDVVAPELRRWIEFALKVLPDTVQAVCGDARAAFIPGGGEIVDALRKGTMNKEDVAAKRAEMEREIRARTVAHEGGGAWYDNRNRKQTVSGRHQSNGMGGTPGVTPGNHPG